MFRHGCRHMARIALVCLLFAASTASAYDLTVRVTDTTTARDATSGWLTVYVTNPIDSVAGFQIWVKLDRPDIITLSTVFGGAGTVAEQFRYYDVRSVIGSGVDVLITALAEYPPKPTLVRGFGPSSVEQVLARIPFTVQSLPPGSTNNLVRAVIETSFLDKFSFARVTGSSIGIAFRYQPDSICYHCTQWSGTTCLAWTHNFIPPCDSVVPIIDTIPYLDTTLVKATSGSVRIGACTRTGQDFDINLDGVSFAVSDYVALILFVQGNNTDLLSYYAADFNGDCYIDLKDAIDMNYYLTHGIVCDPGPCTFSCSCDQLPMRRCCYGKRGNMNLDAANMVDLADLSWLVNYLTGGGVTITCYDATNVNGQGIIDLADLSTLVGYLTGNGLPLPNCP